MLGLEHSLNILLIFVFVRFVFCFFFRPDHDQTEADIDRPPSYNEAVENTGSCGDDWCVVPEGEPPPSYDAAMQDSENCSTDSVQDRNGINEAWVDTDTSEMNTDTNTPEVNSK